MSKIEDYFEKELAATGMNEWLASDDFFAKFEELKTLNGRLLAIPREHLDLCGVDPTDCTGTKIIVLNPTKAKELNSEYVTAREKIEAIHALFNRFDPIDTQCRKLGLNCAPTPYGIMRERIEASNRCLKISRRRDNEAAYQLRGRGATADTVSQNRHVAPLTEQLSGLEGRLKAVEILEQKALKLAEA